MTILNGIDARTAPQLVRRAIRDGHYRKTTNGIASDYVQCNIAIVPKQIAQDFSEFCSLNAKACPLLARSEPGNPALPALGTDIDIRTDLPLCVTHASAHMLVTDIPLHHLKKTVSPER